MSSNDTSQIMDLIAKGNIQKAMDTLLSLSLNPEKSQELYGLSERYKRLEKNVIKGILSSGEETLERNKITRNLISFVHSLGQDSSQAAPISSPGERAKKISKKSTWQYVVAAGVIVSILGGLAEFLNYINMVPGFPASPASNTLTVLVHGEKGKDQLVLPSRGEVKLIYGDAIISKQINNEGEATFKQISDKFFEAQAQVEILFQDPEGEPYRAIHPDSLYTLSKGQYVPLAVKLYGLDQIRGIVKDFESGEPIPGVRISIRGEETYSNSYGEYQLTIPPEKQRQFQTIRASKEGYTSYEQGDVPIQTDREIPIMMKPTP